MGRAQSATHNEQMPDGAKTRAQLIDEIQALRQQLAQLSAAQTTVPAEETILAEHVRLGQALLEATPDLLFLLDRQGTVLDYSGPSDSADLLMPPEAFLGKTLREVLPPALADEFEQNRSAAFAQRSAQTVEYLLPIGGRPQTFEARLVAHSDDELLAMVRNITDRRAVEEALRASEEKYRLLFSAAQDAMVLVDAETKDIIEANDAASRLYGYELETLLSMNALQLTARPDASLGMIETTLQLPAGNLDFHLHQNLHRRRDGSTFHVDIAAAPVTVDGRRTIYAVFRDISAQVEAAQALVESRERFRELAEHIREVFWLFDWVNQKVLYVSPAYEEVWGRRAADLYERYEEWGESIHPDDQTYAAESFARIVETGGGEVREYRIMRPDGAVRWVSDRGFAIVDDAGQVVRIAGLAEDISERKEQERQRNALIAALEQTNAELERFTYTVSHDLKSPLITIKGFLGYVEQDIAEGNVDRARADLARIEKAADTMGELLDELLDLSRIGRVVNPPEHVPLVDLVHEVVAQMARRLAEHRVKVTVDPALPTVVGDRVRLREVFENLVDNAMAYMGDNPEPRIEIGVRGDNPPGEAFVITVRDNGIGIESRYQERVFRLFEKLDPTTAGSGIGLAIVKRIIEFHNGRIWVESKGLGHGTAFCFTLADIEPAQPGEANQA